MGLHGLTLYATSLAWNDCGDVGALMERNYNKFKL